MCKTICVYGWYGQHTNNLGDNLFRNAFHRMFPDADIIFTDAINEDTPVKDVSFFVFGGGSFLFSEPNISQKAFEIIKQKPIFYIGVGAETAIHRAHIELMTLAKLIAIRNDNETILDKVRRINPNTIYVPDLVYSISYNAPDTERKNSVLVVPNLELIPTHKDAYWQIAAWQHYKFYIAEALDALIERGIGVDFLSFCNHSNVSDSSAATEIINHMEHRNHINIYEHTNDLQKELARIRSYKAVITQRYHGIILSELANTAHIILYHHDKLKYHNPSSGYKIDYYAASKDKLIEAFDQIYDKPCNFRPINQDIFEGLAKEVYQLIG